MNNRAEAELGWTIGARCGNEYEYEINLFLSLGNLRLTIPGFCEHCIHQRLFSNSSPVFSHSSVHSSSCSFYPHLPYLQCLHYYSLSCGEVHYFEQCLSEGRSLFIIMFVLIIKPRCCPNVMVYPSSSSYLCFLSPSMQQDSLSSQL